MLRGHFTRTFFILFLLFYFLENLLIFVCLFYPKNGAIDFTKTFITQEWLVVESCLTPRWITFLMLYRLVYNIRSHFNELILKSMKFIKLGVDVLLTCMVFSYSSLMLIFVVVGIRWRWFLANMFHNIVQSWAIILTHNDTFFVPAILLVGSNSHPCSWSKFRQVAF